MFKKLVVGNLSFDLIALARLKELGNLFKDIRRLQTSLDGAVHYSHNTIFAKISCVFYLKCECFLTPSFQVLGSKAFLIFFISSNS